MIFIILLIYFVILIVIEVLFLIFSEDKNRPSFNIESFNDLDKHIENNKLVLKESSSDINIKDFTGIIIIKNYYGFFVENKKWNLIQSNKQYNFNNPVDITIIKTNFYENIKYFVKE